MLPAKSIATNSCAWGEAWSLSDACKILCNFLPVVSENSGSSKWITVPSASLNSTTQIPSSFSLIKVFVRESNSKVSSTPVSLFSHLKIMRNWEWWYQTDQVILGRWRSMIMHHHMLSWCLKIRLKMSHFRLRIHRLPHSIVLFSIYAFVNFHQIKSIAK